MLRDGILFGLRANDIELPRFDEGLVCLRERVIVCGKDSELRTKLLLWRQKLFKIEISLKRDAHEGVIILNIGYILVKNEAIEGELDQRSWFGNVIVTEIITYLTIVKTNYHGLYTNY